ncbi:MerR family transcriptional regulator [Bacillus chungangensis]|uniref:DNA-binding transcriptional MerR regulator n=1 Tax=Bacillus chungangensis TaxID=587633 RepID=A0ABT9WQD5_9BACI|nr:MerR family transcriptional regulator [Bacillus chungangensis]MDQ0175437.1 DNA-binding transcriptional MerR regulator [Bacillus chungangensis]
MRIGELAEITNVTKRTIDYYTNIGLLKAERSTSNYRYYDHSSIERLLFIERCKEKKMSLQCIKKLLLDKNVEEIDVKELSLKMKGLKKEVDKVLSTLHKGNANSYEYIKKNISPEALSLIQTLLLLLSD